MTVTRINPMTLAEAQGWVRASLTARRPGVTTPDIAAAMGVRVLDLIPLLRGLVQDGIVERTLIAADGEAIGTDYDDDEDDVGIWHWRLLARPVGLQ